MADLPQRACTRPDYQRTIDRYRGSAASRGYGQAWSRDRDIWIRRNPLCCDPYQRHPNEARPTNVRDHKVRRALGGPDHDSNYQPLCYECDAYKRALEAQGKAGTWETEKTH